MEAYLNYITTIAVDVDPPLQPVYGIIHNQPLEERIAADLAGFRAMGPVRVGNQASEQTQHDAYGSVILGPRTCSSTSGCRAWAMHLSSAVWSRWENRRRWYGTRCRAVGISRPQRIHTHSATMCWVAADRLARIACA